MVFFFVVVRAFLRVLSVGFGRSYVIKFLLCHRDGGGSGIGGIVAVGLVTVLYWL